MTGAARGLWATVYGLQVGSAGAQRFLHSPLPLGEVARSAGEGARSASDYPLSAVRYPLPNTYI